MQALSLRGKETDMSAPPKYRRVLLKVSGEALLGDQPFGIDEKMVDRIAVTPWQTSSAMMLLRRPPGSEPGSPYPGDGRPVHQVTPALARTVRPGSG